MMPIVTSFLASRAGGAPSERLRCVAAAALVATTLMATQQACAGAITVGLGAACTEHTIQAAIDRAYRLCDRGFCGYNLILVTDDVVWPAVRDRMPPIPYRAEVILPSGEAHKTIASVERIWDTALSIGIDRRSTLLAVAAA